MNIEVSIVPGDAYLALGVVVVGALVEKISRLGSHVEAMSKARWYPDLGFILGAQYTAKPLTAGGRIGPQVNGDIENRAIDHPYQFALCVLGLNV